jgi:hypothetical protein
VISNLCEALLRAYRDRGKEVSGELLPGLTCAEVEARTSWFPAPLPGPVFELYGWRNGQPEDAWVTENVLWFRDMQFTSLERAKDEYCSMMASYGVDNSRELEGIELRTSFPFASFNGGWYVVPCTGHDLGADYAYPVVSVFQGIDVYFHSIESMLKTCIDWRLASRLVGDDWELPEDRERSIWQQHNPRVLGGAV